MNRQPSAEPTRRAAAVIVATCVGLAGCGSWVGRIESLKPTSKLESLARRCDEADLGACFALGERLYEVYKRTKDAEILEMSLDSFRDACRLGERSGCGAAKRIELGRPPLLIL